MLFHAENHYEDKIRSQHEIISGLNREIVEIRQNYSLLQKVAKNKLDEVDNEETANWLKEEYNVITSENNQESTNLIQTGNENETLTEVEIVGENKVGIKRFNKTKTKLKQHKLSTSEEIPDKETKRRRKKEKQYATSKTYSYSSDSSIDIIEPNSIHLQHADIVTSAQRKTSTDLLSSQDDDKLQDLLQ
ncbi:hypothetical protein JTB14_022668 [Gonioctena quinquepunctata]|nr:hypothetical protein JTB14_022668 [Gonioctena quinquepunctata]